MNKAENKTSEHKEPLFSLKTTVSAQEVEGLNSRVYETLRTKIEGLNRKGYDTWDLETELLRLDTARREVSSSLKCITNLINKAELKKEEESYMSNVQVGDYIKIINTTPFDEAVGILVGNIEKVTEVFGDVVYIASGFGNECSVAHMNYVKLSDAEIKSYFENIKLFKSKRKLVADIISIVEESAYQDSKSAIEELNQAKSCLDELIALEKEILVKEMKAKNEHC